MKYQAIIFDMDGTIIATESAWELASLHLLKQHTNMNEQEYKAVLAILRGASLYTTCAYIKKTFNVQASIEELMEQKLNHAFGVMGSSIRYIQGFEKFHETLVHHNLKSAIATNATDLSIDKILQTVPLGRFFKEHIYGIDRVNKTPKPKPDIYLFAAQQLNVDPNFCIAIEDSAHGINAAKAAGMFCIGINSGNDRNVISHADLVIENYDDLDLTTLL